MSLADLYAALADPTRLRVLELLHDKARPVHELAGAFDISRPAISRHLRVLKEAGLVKEVKQGRENLYSLQRAELKPGIEWLEKRQRRVKGKAKQQVAVEVPVVVAELIVMPEPVVALAQVVEPVLVAQPKAPANPKVAKSEPQPTVPPPPKQAPQLSFFDL